MNGNVTFVGLNFLERKEEKHLKKEGNDGETVCVARVNARFLMCNLIESILND